MYTEKLVFKGKRRKIHIHQSAFKVFVGDPFAQYWCIDFGLLTTSPGNRGIEWNLYAGGCDLEQLVSTR